jgi:hypothetical protein
MNALERDATSMREDAVSRRAELLVRLKSAPQVHVAERRSLPAGAGARLATLLREIDETVLPRVLRLTSGPRDVARLIVSQRRLISVEMPGRATVPPQTDHLAEAMAARLIEIAELRSELSVTLARRTSVPNHAETACSVVALRAALASSSTRNGFDRQLRHASARCSARVLWSEANPQAQFSGVPEWDAPLRTLVERYRALGRTRQAAARVSPHRMEGVLIPIDAQQVVVIASAETTGFAVVLPRKAGLDLVAAWPFN